MKYTVKTIDASQWLNIVNQEADPNVDKAEFSYYSLGDKYAVHLASGVGNFVSEMFKPTGKNIEKQTDAFFDKATKELQDAYDKRKSFLVPYAGFLSVIPGVKAP